MRVLMRLVRWLAPKLSLGTRLRLIATLCAGDIQAYAGVKGGRADVVYFGPHTGMIVANAAIGLDCTAARPRTVFGDHLTTDQPS